MNPHQVPTALMTSTPDTAPVHYAVDASRCPSDAWRAVAAHHLLTSRHRPEATLSFPGVDPSTARHLRIYATELGLSGLRIPDDDIPPACLLITLGANIPADAAPSVLCEAINVLLDEMTRTE